MPARPPFLLNAGSDLREVTRPDQLEWAIEDVAGDNLEFAIVEDADGSYLQWALAHGQLIAEWREVLPAPSAEGRGFRHVKLTLPRPGGDEPMPLLPRATVPYRRDELLTVDDVQTAARQFITTGEVGAPFVLLDISDWF